MSDLRLITLSKILLEVPKSEGGYIYLQGEHPWSLYSKGLIFVYDGYEENSLEVVRPDFYQEHKLQGVMDVYEAQDVIIAAQNQKRGLLMREVVACFNHYFQYDGYLQWSD